MNDVTKTPDDPVPPTRELELGGQEVDEFLCGRQAAITERQRDFLELFNGLPQKQEEKHFRELQNEKQTSDELLAAPPIKKPATATEDRSGRASGLSVPPIKNGALHRDYRQKFLGE